MKFAAPLIEGRLLRRYWRFLADVDLGGGTVVTAHCPNTGSMLGCARVGSRVWLSRHDSGTRKYPHTWELVEADGVLVGINTGRTNRLVEEAVAAGVIPELAGYRRLRREVRYGAEGSRIDLLLEDDGRAPCYVEIKNVTAAVHDGIALFPDAVSARGAKHLREMMAMVAQGHRAVLVFCVQRADALEVRPADAIDPEYGRALRRALAAGVEAVACRAEVTPEGIRVSGRVPVVCP
ncbi:MAG: DNA/RNA nuclease SfsA [Pseudomonadota bacterium]